MPARPAISGLKRSLTVDVQLLGVIPEIDIWRAAQLMLKRIGNALLQPVLAFENLSRI
jgi:hypothetical protein